MRTLAATPARSAAALVRRGALAWPWLIIGLAASICPAQQLILTPLDPSGIYDLNEPAGWSVHLPQGVAAPTGNYTYTVKKNNAEVIKTGRLDLSSGAGKIEVSLDEPAMIYVEVTPPGENGARKKIVVGAAIAPTRLQPSVPRPSDFDAFWEAKIKLLKEIPENPVLTPGESGRPDVQYATIVMDHVDDTHVFGQLAKPRREGKFPALVILQWASPPYPLEKSWVTDRAAEGWLALNIEPHDVPPDRPRAYYDALPDTLKHYESLGNDDRDKSYFVRMYLRDYRAVDYIASRPDWDGKTLVVMGTSMGGQQSLCVAGLHPQVTHVIVDEPAGCDTNGPLHGRQSSYPFFPADKPRVMEAALYVDPVNFAPGIKATSLVAMGFVDTIAAPAGIWTAFNQIRGPKEAVPMIDSPHNNLATPEEQLPYTERSAQWLDTLVKGGEVTPRVLEPSQRVLSGVGN
jgi:cephalosporin-C deacetylase